MRNVILGEKRHAFRNDISTALMLDSYPLNVALAKDFEELLVAADRQKDALLIISDSMLEDFDSARVSGRTVYSYASTPDGIRSFQEAGIPCMGLIKTSSKLLSALTAPSITTMSNSRRQETPPAASPVPQPQMKEPEPEQPPTAPAMPAMPNMTQEQMAQFIQMFQMMQSMSQQPATQTHPPQPLPNAAETTVPKQKQTVHPVDDAIERDLLAGDVERNRKTRVVTVYAAKGGVGKTSIATELAVCLALTTNGRRKFRVCIVDYNIDFGDVASTLEFSETGPNMSYWASEIRELLEQGKVPEEIQFSRKEMESCYLQEMKKTGLFALIAPIMHEDSMFIKAAELQVMLNNIVDNGQFDYVICDTGNNTRDSSVIAIDRSDYILLVATQDVTTANCNASVLRTLRDTGFDTDKIRLVVNSVMPSRETGVSVQEVEETFPYDCICRIKRTPDIIRANNLGRPLVYNPKHEYTKQIQQIVRFVTTGEAAYKDEEKRGFFRKRRKE
ncbi:MAG: P-loop NTPase [Methanocorpusculum sp.]|nr:P-loop NTPase [Methanocorpusculum sp.]